MNIDSLPNGGCEFVNFSGNLDTKIHIIILTEIVAPILHVVHNLFHDYTLYFVQLRDKK